MRILKRQDILAAAPLKTETIPTPEWGEDSGVIIRALSGLQREALDRAVFEARSTGKPYSVLGSTAAFSIIDEDGRLQFSPEEVLQVAQLNQGPLERIWDWQRKHSGLGAEALEESVKNSGAGQNGVTSSTSPAPSAG